MDVEKIMEELEKNNLLELFVEETKSGIKKDVLIKIYELKEEGKTNEEIIEIIIKYLEED
ncbi:MAG: hypothetical protein PUI98_01580 [Finegoldia magna]|nr:hypothetical protein [Finegoldia magna]